ncbi:MAG: hypothetical protein Q9163_002237 [Psora crenata]
MATRQFHMPWLSSYALALLLLALGEAAKEPKTERKASYTIGDAIPISCLNRTIIPTHPLTSAESLNPNAAASQPASPADTYIPLIFALSGTLQLSHLHVNSKLNVLMHTSPDLEGMEADILAASAYSSPSVASTSTRVVIGDPLALQLSVRWYSSPSLPPSTTATAGLGGHVHFSTFIYCLLSCGAGVAASFAYFRGVELPRRLRTYGKDRMGGERGGGYAFPGAGMMGMNGYSPGKRD